MLYIHDTQEIELDRASVVTIGKFDGFHLGHQKLLETSAHLRREGEALVLFTFSRSPQMVLAGRVGRELNTHEEKIRMAEKLGVDVLIEYPFTRELRCMSAEDFLDQILLKKLKAAHIVAGPDCRFGHERRGNIAFLKEHAAEGQYQVHVVQKEEYRLTPISSTRIREALSKGQVEEVNDMLGYTFGYKGEVVHGRQLGRTLGFPTINQWIPESKCVPAFGVYATEVIHEGRRYPAISNVGVKPTISGNEKLSVETYLYDYEGDLYGSSLTVNLLHFIRPEKKFSSLEALKKQVDRDKIEVHRYHYS